MATLKQKKAIAKMLENGGNVSKAMREVGYSAAMAKNPQKFKESKTFKSYASSFSDDLLKKTHKDLLKASRLDHMTFPLETPELTDNHVIELLKDVNCIVRKIVHGEQARHVYFWAADNRARKEGLDMAYKIKGTYAPEKSVNLNIEIEADPLVKELTAQLNAIHRGASISSNGRIAGALGAEAQDQK